MKKLFLAAVICLPIGAIGADKNYPVSDIPEELKKGMYAVIRERTIKITITDINKYTLYSKMVVTILNSNANEFAYESVPYDKLTKVNFFKGAAYDAEGNVIKKLKASDIYDRSYISSASLFDDTRLKQANLEQSTYPYTVEFEFEQQNSFLYDFPDFVLSMDDEVSTQKANYILSFNESFPPRFKTFKVGEPKKSKEDGLGVYSWFFENIIPEKFEPLSLKRTSPYIMSGPSVFEYSGYRGDMSSWESYAKWNAELLIGRDELPLQTVQKVKELTKPLATREEKIKAVYEYVQSKTRYVNISLGIGGLQPFPAKVVDEVGYGDCKGLSNYTIALLRAIGIEGLYTTIKSGKYAQEVVEDFPSHQANHVIVTVPNGQDTIWLECTSQTTPTGFMGSFTDNRKALVITSTGGKLIKTPTYLWPSNGQTRTAMVKLEPTGDATAKIKTTYTGLQSENENVDGMLTQGTEKQKEWLQNNITIPNFNIVSFNLIGIKKRIPSVVVSAELSLRKLGVVNGKRVFITPNLMNKSATVLPKSEARKNDVYIRTGFIDADTIEYSIPEGLYAEFTPEPINIKSRFGEYSATFALSQGKLVYIRRFQMTGGTYPPESYAELGEFYKSINKADNTKVVFVNKT